MSNTIEDHEKIRSRIERRLSEILMPKPLDENSGKAKVLVIGPYGVLRRPKYYPFEGKKVIIKRGGQGKGPGWSPEFDSECFIRQRKGVFVKRLKGTMLVVREGGAKCINFQKEEIASYMTRDEAKRLISWLVDEQLFNGIKNAMKGQLGGPIIYILLGVGILNLLMGMGIIG